MISTGQSFFQLIIVLLCFVGVLVLAYFTTRWLANYQKGRSFNKNLKIIETIKLSPDKYVQIVACGKERYLILGLSKNEVTMLGEMTADELIEVDTIISDDNEPGNVTTTFSQIIDKMKSKK
ncbi:MAG: flagellar biosynthetic protein FliO [Lachnospiraceae bacterium]|nr:flagellar biosynthetic protein FliO [Lachnospiraceae bacterium]